MSKALLLITTSIILSACQNPANDDNLTTYSPKQDHFQSGLTASKLAEQCSRQLDQANTSFKILESLPPPFTVDSLVKPVDQLLIDIDTELIIIDNG